MQNDHGQPRRVLPGEWGWERFHGAKEREAFKTAKRFLDEQVKPLPDDIKATLVHHLLVECLGRVALRTLAQVLADAGATGDAGKGGEG